MIGLQHNEAAGEGGALVAIMEGMVFTEIKQVGGCRLHRIGKQWFAIPSGLGRGNCGKQQAFITQSIQTRRADGGLPDGWL